MNKDVAIRKMTEVGLPIEAAKKELSFAVQLIARDSNLQQCDANSVMAAVINVANIGLTLNPAAKESYLISRWDKKSGGKVASLEPSYIGLQNLAVRTGAIKSMTTQVVYANDQIEINLADNINPVRHIPELSKAKRGDAIGVYALATLPDGTRQVEWMDVDEINEVRNYSDSWKSFEAGKIPTCVWAAHWGEMARKTVVKRVLKYLPKGANEQLNAAIALDNQDYKAEFWQLDKIDQLSQQAGISDELDRKIRGEIMHGMTFHRANEWINSLKEMVPSGIRYGDWHTAKDKIKAVHEKVNDPKA